MREFSARVSALGCAALLVWAALSLTGCPFGIPQDTANLRILCVAPSEFAAAAGAKVAGGSAIGPLSGSKVGSYRLTFSLASGETITRTIGRGAEEVRLKVGAWNILAEGLAQDGSVLLEKQITVNAEAGKTISVPIALHLAKGKGSLDIVFAPSQPPSQGWKYSLSLSYRGLPGDASFSGPAPSSYELQASETNLSIAELPSGFYTLSAQLLDAAASVVAGATVAALVVPRQVSTGTCAIALSDPSVGIAILPPSLELSVQAAMGVDRTVARSEQLSVPLAVAISQPAVSASLYANGAAVSDLGAVDGAPLSGYALSVSNITADPSLSAVRVDAILTDPLSDVAQSLSSTCEVAPGPSSGNLAWLQSIDCQAALAPCLTTAADPATMLGSGLPSAVKCVSANTSGLIALTGLDGSSAVHLFYSPAGMGIVAEDGGSAVVPASVGWLRLWRDKATVNGNEYSPNRACVSEDGQRLAVAGSTSNWLKMYTLDGAGAIVAKSDIVQGMDGFADFGAVKALRFSADSKRLYVLVNSPPKIVVLNVDMLERGEACVESEFLFASCFESPGDVMPALKMEDCALLSDGWIAACSSDVGMIFFIRYSETDGQFTTHSVCSTGPNGESLGEPRAVAFDPSSGTGYIIGNSKKLHIATMTDAATGYALSSTLSLSADFDKAKSLALVRSDSGSAYLATATGTSLSLVRLGPGGEALEQSALSNIADYPAIGSANNICAFGSTLITSGEDTNCAASFYLR